MITLIARHKDVSYSLGSDVTPLSKVPEEYVDWIHIITAPLLNPQPLITTFQKHYRGEHAIYWCEQLYKWRCLQYAGMSSNLYIPKSHHYLKEPFRRTQSEPVWDVPIFWFFANKVIKLTQGPYQNLLELAQFITDSENQDKIWHLQTTGDTRNLRWSNGAISFKKELPETLSNFPHLDNYVYFLPLDLVTE